MRNIARDNYLHTVAGQFTPDGHRAMLDETRGQDPAIRHIRSIAYHRSTAMNVLVNGKWHKRAGIMRN